MVRETLANGRPEKKVLRPSARRATADWFQAAFGVIERRAVEAGGFNRSSHRYRSSRDPQTHLRMRLKELAETRVRYGYRRLHVLLRREGWEINHNRTYRLYSEEGLSVRTRTPKRRRAYRYRSGRAEANGANDVWAMDFVHDQLATGRKLRILTVVDTFSRFSPVIDPRFSYKGEDVVRKLDDVCKRVGYPKTIRVDNGSEFVSRDMDLWAYKHNITLDFSRPGKPTYNSYIEAFNRRLRQECLNASWFLSMGDARARIEEWRIDYNLNRPHSALGGLTPAEFAGQLKPARNVA